MAKAALSAARAAYWFAFGYALGTDSGYAWVCAVSAAIAIGVARHHTRTAAERQRC